MLGRRGTCLLTAIMLAASCGSADGGAPSTTAGPGGSTTAGEGGSTTEAPDGSSTVPALLAEPLGALRVACGDAVAWSGAAVELQSTIDAITTDADDLVITEDEAGRLLGDVRRQVFRSPCEATARTATPAARAGARAEAGRLSAAIDELELALVERPIQTSSRQWYNADHLNQTIEMERLVTSGQLPDVTLVGSSIAKFGFDPRQLEDRLGGVVWNAAIGAMTPVVASGWDRQMRARLAPPPSTVIRALGWFEDFGSCSTEMLDAFMVDLDQSSVAFDSLAFLDDVPGPARIFGGVPESYDGPFLAASRELMPAGSRGRIIIDDQPSGFPASVRDIYRSNFRDDVRCGLVRDAVIEWVETWQREGARVVVVAMPTSRELIDLHPEGQSAVDGIVADYRARVTEAGGEFLDLTDVVGPQQLRDLTHVNATGRQLVSEALADFLTDGP